MRYYEDSYLLQPYGNNAIDFEQRKKWWSESILRIPPLIHGTLDEVRLSAYWICYEYVDEKGRLIYDYGLENLVEMNNEIVPTNTTKKIFVVDNHNHAFYCRWKAYLKWDISWWSQLLHIDQHSDLNEATNSNNIQQIAKNSTLFEVATYTNEVLDIASFIKPAKEIGLISEYEMILTEYSLLKFWILNSEFSIILDIDLDFRAPEMSIQEYEKTITMVRKLIDLPQVWCVTIATSPTYIDQKKALEILHDIVD